MNRAMILAALMLSTFINANADDLWRVAKVEIQYQVDSGGEVKWRTFPGSAVLVDGAKAGKTYALTAAHVDFGKPTKLTIRAALGDKAFPARFVRQSEGADVSLLEIDGPLPVTALADRDPTTGSTVSFYGQKSGLQSGTVTRSYHQPAFARGPVYGLSIRSESGDSGAGLFHAGKLVGIMSGGGGTTGEAVRLSVLKQLVGK